VDLRPIAPLLVPFLTDTDYDVRLRALRIINWGCRPVPPELVKAALALLDDTEFLKYQDESDRKAKYHRTDSVVWLCGSAAIPKLLKYLASDDKELREFAVRGLRGISGPGAEALLPTFRELAAGKKKHPEITHLDAASAVIGISLDPKDVELLLPFLKYDDPGDRGAAYEFIWLRHLGRPYLKHLFPLLKDRDAGVRRVAAMAINSVAPSDPDACAALARWIVDSGDRIWLDDTGPFAKEIAPAVPAVLKMLQRGEKYDPLRGFETVRRIGPAAKDAVPLLLPYLTREPDSNMPDDADLIGPNDVLRTLGAIGPAAKDAVPLIRKRLAKAEDRERMWCLLCLADIGPGAKDAVPELRELLIDPDPELRLLAACALSKIEADPAAYRATFVRAIHERPGCVLWNVPFVFDRIAADCPEVVPVVVRGIIPRSGAHVGWPGYYREYGTVMRALKRNAAVAKGAVPDLVNYLNNPPDWGRRTEFIELLGAIGPDAKAALPKLRELRDIAAQEAIQKIESKK
jgi:HEAT repeat protein